MTTASAKPVIHTPSTTPGVQGPARTPAFAACVLHEDDVVRFGDYLAPSHVSPSTWVGQGGKPVDIHLARIFAKQDAAVAYAIETFTGDEGMLYGRHRVVIDIANCTLSQHDIRHLRWRRACEALNRQLADAPFWWDFAEAGKAKLHEGEAPHPSTCFQVEIFRTRDNAKVVDYWPSRGRWRMVNGERGRGHAKLLKALLG